MLEEKLTLDVIEENVEAQITLIEEVGFTYLSLSEVKELQEISKKAIEKMERLK